MEKKLKEKKNPSKASQASLKQNLYLENKISKLETLRAEIIDATEEFLAHLNDLSPTQVDLNGLFAEAFTMADEILFILGKMSDHEQSVTVQDIKEQLEDLKSNFNDKIISELNTQKELISLLRLSESHGKMVSTYA